MSTSKGSPFLTKKSAKSVAVGNPLSKELSIDFLFTEIVGISSLKISKVVEIVWTESKTGSLSS